MSRDAEVSDKSNVLMFNNMARLKHHIVKMTDEAFSKRLYGFTQVDDYTLKMKRLSKRNTSAFWSEIGPLGRKGFADCLARKRRG